MTAVLVRLGEDTFAAHAPASIIEDVLLPLAGADQALEEARKARPDESRRPEGPLRPWEVGVPVKQGPENLPRRRVELGGALLRGAQWPLNSGSRF